MGTGVLGLGAGILAVAMAVLVVVLHAAGTHPHAVVGPVLFVAGLGLGLFVAPLTNLVLAGSQGREAGSASGTLSTVQQIGGALGVALIGLVLFTLLGGHAATAVATQTPSVTRALTAAGLPAGTVSRVVSGRGGLEDCFVRRSTSPDPSRPPPGCAPQKGGPAAVAAALQTAGRQAGAEGQLPLRHRAHARLRGARVRRGVPARTPAARRPARDPRAEPGGEA